MSMRSIFPSGKRTLPPLEHESLRQHMPFVPYSSPEHTPKPQLRPELVPMPTVLAGREVLYQEHEIVLWSLIIRRKCSFAAVEHSKQVDVSVIST